MAVRIVTASQKGGTGKSTVARLVAREYANAGWSVKIADLDISQSTSLHWHRRRLQHAIEPIVAVESFGTVDQAVKATSQFDLVIFDAPPHSTAGTLKAAQVADLVVLPTGLSLDDLQPTVLLAHELVKKGVPKNKLAFAFCRVGDSHLELIEGQMYVTDAGYRVLSGSIPEKTAYRRASDEGRAVTETKYESLNKRADKLAQSIINLLTILQKKAA